VTPHPAPSFAALYPAFEARFRGSEDDIRARLTAYLPDVDRAARGRPVLDIGPGRGEWLSLLAERGVPAYGIDADPQFAASGRAAGLDVLHGDAVTHLWTVAPASLDMVTAFHVIEHLGTDTLVEMLAAARRALHPGGLLVLETPNPSNLVMGACNFYLDPTHQRPLPAALTDFLVRSSGFTDVEVRPLHPREDVDLSGLRLEGVAPEVARLLAEALGKAFFGPQDYAVVGRVPAAELPAPRRPG